jgi:ketosteroid isomerase-like protein
MMKAKNVQSIICLVIFFLFANQAWAVDWIYFDKAAVGDVYYSKNSIKKVDKSIILVWNKVILSKEGKTKYFSTLKGIHKAPQNPSMLSYYKKLMEIDCINRKIKDISVTFYNEKGKVVYSSSKSEIGDWNAILPDTVGEKLINIVSCEPVTPKEAVVAPKVEEPVTPKEAVVAPKVEEPVTDAKVKEPAASNEAITATAAPVAADNPDRVNNKQIETKSASEKAVRNLLTKWLNSWKSGDMKTYRSCYESNFQSEVTYINALVSYKTNVHQKSKKMNISIEKLQISADENIATAVFTQHYSSAILKYSGKKKLELRKINDEWKIYREIM